MFCEMCKKNKASVIYKEVVNDTVTEYRLCEACAAERDGDDQDGPGEVTPQEKSTCDALKIDGVPVSVQTKKCSRCGYTFASLQKNLRVGCGYCYESFKKQLNPVIVRLQGSAHHIGKSPRGDGDDFYRKRQMMRLRAALQDAVEHERFEDAAHLRDQIRTIERIEQE